MGNRNIPRIFGNATQIFDVMAVMTYDPWLAVVYLPFFYPLNGRSSGSNSVSYCCTVVRTICLAGNFQQHIFWGYPLTYSTNTKMEFQVFWYVWPYFLGIFPEKKSAWKISAAHLLGDMAPQSWTIHRSCVLLAFCDCRQGRHIHRDMQATWDSDVEITLVTEVYRISNIYQYIQYIYIYIFIV